MWNFSRDFLTHIPEALVVLQVCDVGWSDRGTPESVERTLLALSLRSPGVPKRGTDSGRARPQCANG